MPASSTLIGQISYIYIYSFDSAANIVDAIYGYDDSLGSEAAGQLSAALIPVD